MRFFSRASNARTLSLVLHIDVGLGGARAALVEHGGASTPSMPFTSTHSEKVPRKGKDGLLSASLLSLRESIDDVISFIQRENKAGRPKKIGAIYAILAAPYYLSHTALIKYKEEKSFVVTPALVSNILHGYRKHSDKDREDESEEILGNAPITVADKIIGMRLNGYHTGSPYGKKAITLDLSVFKTEVAGEAVLGIEREIKKRFALPVIFESLSLAVYVALRGTISFNPNFLFIVVGNEVTEVSLVRDHMLLKTISFPFGKFSLIRHVAREVGEPEEMAISSISLHGVDGLHTVGAGKIEAALQTAAKTWAPFFEKGLVSLSDRSAVPHSVYLVADPDVGKAFQGFLTSDGYVSQSLVPTGFAIELVDVEKAKSIMHFGPEASCDPILCLEGLFAVSTKLPLHTRGT